jgi:proline dehydrogenase
MSVFDRLALLSLPLIPRPVMRRLASRYIAGERLEDALAKLGALRAQGFAGIVDLLGEDVHDEAQARAVLASYVEVGRAVRDRQLDAYVSVKPTHLGLRLSAELAHELYASLARELRALGLFLRVEMEDHTTTDATLALFAKLRAEFDNVGIVLQSRLFRTPDDIRALPRARVSVRMVKGIYLEPAEIAHVEPEPIRAAYLEEVRALWQRGDFVSLATHDEGLAERAFAIARELKKSSADYELQVLLGVREPLWHAWRDAGHKVRVYVPFGPEWRAYSQRRLRKNPQIFRHVLRDTLGLS